MLLNLPVIIQLTIYVFLVKLNASNEYLDAQLLYNSPFSTLTRSLDPIVSHSSKVHWTSRSICRIVPCNENCFEACVPAI